MPAGHQEFLQLFEGKIAKVLIDKTHIRWGLTSAFILVLATGGYIAYAVNTSSPPSGGTIVGLLFGIVASGMMIFAGLLAVRTRFPTVRCGSSQFWLRGHLWLGALSFVFALFHSGFQFGSTLETTLMIAFIIVIASGLHGLAMQQVLPRLLTSRVPLETFGQQVPFLCRRMQAEADMLVAESCGQLECDHEAISDAAYNLAVALGKLRNGKEGTDFQKFLNATYSDGQSKEMPTSAVRATQIEVAASTGPTGQTAGEPAVEPKAKQASKPKAADAVPAATQNAEKRPMSKVEMMRAAAAKKKAAAEQTNQPNGSGETSPVKNSGPHKTSPKLPPPEEADAAKATMTTEVISVACPNCEKKLILPDRSFLGRIARCPQCSQKFVLGGEEETNSSETPARPVESSTSTSQTKIEQMRAAGSENGEMSQSDNKPRSKIEQMRAQAAKKREQKENVDKPLSKIDQMRAAAKAKSTSGDASNEKSPKKPTRPKSKKPPKKTPVSNEPIPRAELLKSFYLSSVRPYLQSDQIQAAATKWAVSPQIFAQTRNNLPPQLHGTLNRLQEFCEERRQFLVQKRLHWLLHSWLLIHVPATIVLFVLFLVHVVVALRVIPWNP